MREMEPRKGGIFGLLGAIILLLSVPFAISVSLVEINARFGISLPFEQLLAFLQKASPGLYVAIISGIALNIILGVLLALLSAVVMLGKGNDTIAMLMTILGIIGSSSSFALVGGIVGVFGAILAIIGGAISSPSASLTPPEALFVAEGLIDGKDLVDWIFCENKIVVAHTVSMAIRFGGGFIIVFWAVILEVIAGVGWIIGTIWAAIVGGIVSWAFTTILRNRKRRKLQGLSPDQILEASHKNFPLSYSDVTSTKVKKGRATVVTLTWNKRKGIITIPQKKLEFEQAKTLLTKLLGDKISFT